MLSIGLTCLDPWWERHRTWLLQSIRRFSFSFTFSLVHSLSVIVGVCFCFAWLLTYLDGLLLEYLIFDWTICHIHLKILEGDRFLLTYFWVIISYCGLWIYIVQLVWLALAPPYWMVGHFLLSIMLLLSPSGPFWNLTFTGYAMLSLLSFLCLVSFISSKSIFLIGYNGVDQST